MDVASIWKNKLLWISIGAVVGNLLVYYVIDVIAKVILVLSVLGGAYTVWKARESEGTVSADNKSVLITGCDSGIGYDLALRAHENGYQVFAACLNLNSEGAKRLTELPRKRMIVLRLDVTSDEEVRKQADFIKQKCPGGLWAVVNNAGINAFGQLELCTMKFFKAVAEVNLFGPIRVTKAFLPLVTKAKGRIVNMSSERGVVFRGLSTVYSVAKGGLEAFSDCLRIEIKSSGVKVSVIQPGHFGGATAILQKEATDAMKRQLLEGLQEVESLPDNTLTRQDVDKLIDDAIASASTSYPNTKPVIDAMMHAISSENPKIRYFVRGSNKLYDVQFVYAKLKPLLPDAWMDRLLEGYMNG